MTARALLCGGLLVAASSCSWLVGSDLDTIRTNRDAGGTAQLIADRAALDFGLGRVGQAGPPALIRLSNIGSAPTGAFTATLTGAAASTFVAGPTAACENLAPGAHCELSLTYTPSAAQVELATLTLTATPGGTLTLPLTGEGIVPGVISVSPEVVDFGSVTQGGQSTAAAFVVRNVGAVPSGMLETGIAGADQLQFELTADGCAGTVLGPDQTCTITTRFAPGLPGPRRASLRVTGSPGGTGVATLIGLGLAGGGQLALSPSTRTFTTVPTGTVGAPIIFRVTNTGSAATGPITLELTGSSLLEFQLGTTDCTVLQPSTSCSVLVRFQPASAGTKVATLVASATPGGAVSASLGATAEANAALEAAPTSLDFGTVLTSLPSIQTVTITNTGARETGMLTPSISQDAGVFTLTGGCNGTLLPTQNCMLGVRFSPTQDGPQSGTLLVQANPGGVVSVPITGLGATPGALTLTPMSWGFGQVAVGVPAMPKTFTVTNTGGSATTSLAVMIGGTNTADFSLPTNQCTGSLGAGASCDVVVRFTPTGGNTRSATLSVTGLNAGTAVAPLSGAGLLPAALRVSPTMENFGSTVGGQTGSTRRFSVFNDGDLATTTALSAALSGPGAAHFQVTGNGCGMSPLAPTMPCVIDVQFVPASGSLGPLVASLDVQPLSGPGGVTTAALSAVALSPSALSFDSKTFLPVFVDAGVNVQTFTLSNDGGMVSGALSFVVGGPSAADFTIEPPGGTDCTTTGLAGGASCTVRVAFRPSAPGLRSADLTATANPGGPAVAQLSGLGLSPALLSSTMTSATVPPTPNGTPGLAVSWLVTNLGDGTSGTPTFMVTGTNQAEFVPTGCTAPLGPGANCTVSIVMTPTGAGPRVANVRMSATPGGAINLALTGTGRSVVTLFKSDAGAGTVWSDGLAINCGPTCFQQTAFFDTGGSVMVHARTNNGGSAVFNGWADGGCSAAESNRDCTLGTSSSSTVRAQFGARDYNLMFLSDVPVPNNLGRAQYDALCNLMAADAGINTTPLNGYIAVKTTDAGTLQARLGAARGFIRMDGRAVSDTQNDLFVNNRMLNPITLDQFGAWHSVYVATGVESDGNSDPTQNCANWTSSATTSSYRFGFSAGGPGGWTAANYLDCAQLSHIYCTMNIRNLALTPQVTPGKRMWLTNTPYLPSVALTPNAKCDSQKPAGVGAVKALVGYRGTSLPPAAALTPGTVYVRPDGQRIGSYEELVNSGRVQTGVWQNNLLAYEATSAWVGHGEPNRLTSTPDPNTTCNDWTSSSAAVSGTGGTLWLTDGRWLSDFWEPCDNPVQRLICVEQ